MSKTSNYLGSSRNIGSAGKLEGKIYLLTVFEAEEEWAYEDKMKYYQKIREAQQWLINEARRYGKNICFEDGCFGLEETIIIPEIKVGGGTSNEDVDIIEPILIKLGYKGNLDFIDWVRANIECDHCVVLVVVNKAGRSYALSHCEKTAPKFYLESCFLHTRYASGQPAYPASIAHEICHCFGAWDLYDTWQTSQEIDRLASLHYPNSIMHRLDADINRLTIDEVTAWRVGLTETHHEFFDNFAPSTERQ